MACKRNCSCALPKRRKLLVKMMARIKSTSTIIDVNTREALAIEVRSRLRGEHLLAALNRLAAQQGAPICLLVDNGSEFTGLLMNLWEFHHKTIIDLNSPGMPTDINALVMPCNTR